MKQTTEHGTPKIPGAASLKGSKARDPVFFQPKLAVNQPGDVYEQEADAMAERVMRLVPPRGNNTSFFSPRPVVVQRKCKECEEEERKARPQTQPAVQRKCAKCEQEEEQVRRKAVDVHVPETDPAFERYMAGLGFQGHPLSAEERQFFEPRFNRDFSDVRVHTGTEASQSAKTIDALAYTVGNHVVFSDGQYQPHTDAGRRLLAHELTHVIQQNGHVAPKSIQRMPNGISASGRCKEYNVKFEGYISNPHGELLYQQGGVPIRNGDQGQPLKNPDGSNVVIPYKTKIAVGDIGFKYWRAVCLLVPQRTNPELFWVRASYVQQVDESLPDKSSNTPTAPPSALWDYIEVIPECPPRARLLNTSVDHQEIAQELYGGQAIAVSLTDDFTFDVLYENLSPVWKPRFKGCVAEEEEIPAEQQVCRADTEYVGDVEITPGRVSAPKGIRLHTTPDVADCDYVAKEGIAATVFAKGTDLIIIAKGNADNEGWVKIQIGDQQYEGWIQEQFVKRISDKDKTKDAVTLLTYTVQTGDKLEPLVREIYKDYPYTTGNDRRTIVHAFSVLNEGSPAIYFEGNTGSWKDIFDPDFAKSRDIYQTIKLYAGAEIRFPTVAYIDYLRDEGQVGVRPEWKNTAIAFARSLEGFLEGIVIGFFKAAWDTVKGLWDLIKGIFTGELLNQAYELYKQIKEKGWSVIWDMIKGFAEGIINDFENAWKNPNPYQKWKFFGEIVGMVVLEVVIAYFTAGAGAARHIGKVDKVLDALPALKKVVTKVGTKLDDIPAKGKLDVSKLGKVEKKIDDLGDMTGETRKMLRDPKHAPMLDSLTDNKKAAKALKKCASPCYKDFLSTRQIDEVEAILRKAETHNVNINYDELKTYFHKAVDADDLDEKIDVLRSGLDRFTYDKSRGVSPFELDRLNKTEKLRNMPGRLSGGDHLPTVTKDNVSTWYGEKPVGSTLSQATEGSIMMPPKQVVDRLKARFASQDITFRKLREEFWKEMYADGVINKFFSDRGAVRSLDEMKNGRAPFALKDGRMGGGANAKLQLNHQQALEHLGDRADEVLNFDNLEIVSPRFHEAMKQ
ncbi:hypothetical protein GCM10007415_07250 [Parapedobacter pyrenivorans]|uniref:eCIS core domain-containing protein n=1 Tax=Parapedobacter pyrenivorans TaxID=1305674 RepID=A0A917M525_9SPHI|nr:DUF4157 domain-containing protein [Parapedobacter pyrenivorans]GGG77807.1 hypothetical protein GCM10007415_07250 [Parapedobacter pyrenivorans]